MKKSFYLNSMLWLMALTAMLVNTRIVSGQTGEEKPNPIPENIIKIFQTSCMQCHGSNGKMLALAKLNFSKWAEYGGAKEAGKATMICSVITNGSMPPKSVSKSNPELIPSDEQIDLICKWAESLKSKEGKSNF
jgi:cytochrome c5